MDKRYLGIKKGGPYFRWEEVFNNVAGGAWRGIARNRKTWKSLEAYVLGQVESTKLNLLQQ